MIDLFVHLEPGVPYSVSIAAVNRAGLGEISTNIVFTRELGIYHNCTLLARRVENPQTEEHEAYSADVPPSIPTQAFSGACANS